MERFLHTVVYRDLDLTLKEPLEDWVVAPMNYTRTWKHLFSQRQDLLYVWNTVGYFVHKQIQYDFDIDPMDFTTVLPPNVVPVEVRQTQYTWVMPSRIATQDLLPPDAAGLPQLWE